MLVGLGFRPRAMAGWGWCWSTDRIVVDIMPSMPWRGWGGGGVGVLPGLEVRLVLAGRDGGQ
jgi:hypothetical protein